VAGGAVALLRARDANGDDVRALLRRRVTNAQQRAALLALFDEFEKRQVVTQQSALAAQLWPANTTTTTTMVTETAPASAIADANDDTNSASVSRGAVTNANDSDLAVVATAAAAGGATASVTASSLPVLTVDTSSSSSSSSSSAVFSPLYMMSDGVDVDEPQNQLALDVIVPSPALLPLSTDDAPLQMQPVVELPLSLPMHADVPMSVAEPTAAERLEAEFSFIGDL
jgi:hypothetical protein